MRTFPLLMLAFVVCPPVGARAEGYRPRVGQFHDDFTLPSVEDGRPVALSRFRGRKVLLVHFASW